MSRYPPTIEPETSATKATGTRAENGTPFVAGVKVDGVERALGVSRLRRVGLFGGSLRSVPSGPAAPPVPSLTRKRTGAP
jgi:hypothetical protein